ncbi:MAG: hypothetical protein KatS3mg063_0537 [Tepidiforma sp.]|uniref:hypothetical protein n=1 Tax=Tepidiforma sp. TaxID=2682230 RepID=UPI0021DF11CA|nr:hypothetical protein [Tepidiforma sp.]GIW14684.1 MAG: hypothetical protein KatS3mg063_0537 [Tepidiforma sp.]
MTTGKGAPKDWQFTGTISDVEPKNWTLTDEQPSVSYEAPKGEDIEVTENAPGDAWVLVGYQVNEGKDANVARKADDYAAVPVPRSRRTTRTTPSAS